MQELIAKIFDYIKVTWVNRWYALTIAWAIVIPGWIYVSQMPDEYESTARVYVDTDSILRPLLKGMTLDTNVGQRLSLLTRTLFSRPNLEKLARMTDLDLTATSPQQTEVLLNDLKKNLRLSAPDRAQPNLYNISYEHQDPQLAKRVVQGMLTIFVESSLGEVRQNSDTAQRFLTRQIEEYEARLVRAENDLLEFRRRYMTDLAGGTDFLTQLELTRTELEQAELELEQVEQQREMLKQQLEDLKDSSKDILPAPVETPETTSLTSRIEVLEANLDEMLLRFTEQHPDVIETRRTIALLKQQRKQAIAEIKTSLNQNLEDSPVYQQLRIGLQTAEGSVVGSRVKVEEYRDRVEKLSRFVENQPEVEVELKSLQREYDIAKRQYDSLVSGLEQVRFSEEVEQTGEDVKFKVVDPPRVPLKPSAPNRPLMMSVVLVAALGVGIGIAFLLTQLRPTIESAKSLKEVTGLPVLGTVAMVWTDRQRHKRRLELASFGAITFVLFVAYVGVLFAQLGSVNMRGLLQSLG